MAQPGPSATAAAARSGRKTVLEVYIPFLDESASPFSVPNGSLADAGACSPTRAEEVSADAAGSSVLANGRQASTTRFAVNRGGSFADTIPASALRRHFTSAGSDPLASSRINLGQAASMTPASTGASQLTKPTLSPWGIRCCPAEQWVPDAHVVNCMAPDCTTSFSLFSRKYRCKMCGRVFCSSCCSTTVSIPVPPSPSTAAAGGGGGGAYGSPPVGSPIGNAAADCSPAAGDAQAPASASPQSSMLFAGPSLVAVAATPASTAAFRVCNGCRYELHLVVSTRDEKGERRRKSRGELKMLQWALIVNILSFLPLPDLSQAALVSSNFYFMSKDNLIWYQYNMTRWVKDADETQTHLRVSSIGANRSVRQRDSSFEAAAVLQDATALTESEAAKRVISLHARNNYTQFLDFTRRQEMARCEGMSSFSVGARILLSSPVKIALIGPSTVGKTASVRAFMGEDLRQVAVLPTVGFTRYVRTVRLVGGLATDVTLHIYDLSGAPRYESLRRFICAQCHAVGLCFDPSRKVTLVEAADAMMEVETALGPQPVIVCGLLRPETVREIQGNATPPRPSLSPHASLPRAPTSGPRQAADTLQSPSLTPAGGRKPFPADHSTTQLVTSPVELGSPPGSVAPSVSNRPARSLLTVSEEDAAGITVRGGGSLQCPVLQCEPFYTALLQCLLERLAMATMAPTATMADISDEVSVSSTGAASVAGSTISRQRTMTCGSTVKHPREFKASKVTAQDLLNLTMQPSVLDILLERK